MTPIQELATKLVPVVEVTLDALGKQLQLFPLRRALDDLQMGLCWLKEANEIYRKEEKESTDVVQDSEDISITPKLTGNQPKFNTLEETIEYLLKNLSDILSTELPKLSRSFRDEHDGRLLRFNIEQVYIKVKEARFNVELGKILYDQLRSERRAAEGEINCTRIGGR